MAPHINRTYFIRSHIFPFFPIDKQKKRKHDPTGWPRLDWARSAHKAHGRPLWIGRKLRVGACGANVCLVRKRFIRRRWLDRGAGHPTRRSQSEPRPCKLGRHHATHQRPSAQRPAPNERMDKDLLSAFMHTIMSGPPQPRPRQSSAQRKKRERESSAKKKRRIPQRVPTRTIFCELKRKRKERARACVRETRERTHLAVCHAFLGTTTWSLWSAARSGPSTCTSSTRSPASEIANSSGEPVLG